jgi:hypothetical protein
VRARNQVCQLTLAALSSAYKLGKEHGLTDVPGQIEPEAPSDNLLPWKLNQTSLPGGLRAE